MISPRKLASRIRLLACWWAGLLLLLHTFICDGAFDPYSGTTQQRSSSSRQTTVRRERNLDHWDADTLAYFLDNYPGYDVAIMFYAQWDRNSHSLAPFWDRIATHMDAGSSSSRLVMALFDCELNGQHSNLCELLGITHYPTLLFVGAGPYHDTDFLTRFLVGAKRSAGPMGPAPVSNTVKFQGNWQFGDAILDWLRTMQALSNWHTWTTKGFGKRLRNFLLPHKNQPKTKLPVGIPGSKPPSSGSGLLDPSMGVGATGSAVDPQAMNAALTRQLESMKDDTETLSKLVMRSSGMLESVLFPIKLTQDTSNQNYTDIYAWLHREKIWDDDVKTTNEQVSDRDILKVCTLEISLDYCQRLAAQEVQQLIRDDELEGMDDKDIEALEVQLKDRVSQMEPFCFILEDCLKKDLPKDDKCRPKTCPFHENVACRYLTGCFDKEIQQDYKEALSVKSSPAATAAKPVSA